MTTGATARVAVTGVGGFIGQTFAARALSRGISVAGADISPEAVDRARSAGVEAFVGDVTDPSDMARLCAGADAVLHTAAVVREGGDWAPFVRINVDGTRTVCSAAVESGVARIVHISSVMVYGFNYPRFVDEDGPLRGENNPYCQTKIDSERVALEHHGRGSTSVVALRPGDVYGPGSIPWVRRPAELMRRGLFVLPDGGRGIMNHVHVDNLVDAVLLAMERERDVGGRSLNVTDGAETTFAEYFGRIAAMRGGRLRSAPSFVLAPFFHAIGLLARVTRSEPIASPEALAFLRRPHPYSNERARRELGWAPRVGLDEGMEGVQRWLAEQGLLD